MEMFQTKEEILNHLKELNTFLNVANVGHNVESWIIFHYLENHAKLHPNKKNRKENQCGDCNIELYNIFSKGKDLATRNTSECSRWINERRKRGYFLSLLHSSQSSRLEFYFDGYMTNFSDLLSSFPFEFNQVFKKGSVAHKKLKQLMDQLILPIVE